MAQIVMIDRDVSCRETDKAGNIKLWATWVNGDVVDRNTTWDAAVDAIPAAMRREVAKQEQVANDQN